MKSFTKFVLALSAVFILSVLCTSASAFGAEKSSKTYEFDLTQFSDWYNGASFDKKTNLFTTKKDGGNLGIGVWNKKDFLNDYNCLVINYTAHNYGFFIELIYNDKSNPNNSISDEIYCPSNLTEFVIPIKKEDVCNDTFVIKLGAPWNHAANVTINKITLENRDNPELSKSYKVPVAQAPIDNGPTKKIDDSLSAWDFLPKMGVGFQYSIVAGHSYQFNFGNDVSYTAYNYPVETKETIHAIAEKGFKTLRLQTTGSFHIIDENLTLDPEFLLRIKQVVDWAIEEGMYVIICNHHDYYYPDRYSTNFNDSYIEESKMNHEYQVKHNYNSGYNLNRKDKDISEKYLKAFWTQICNTFNNSYDEHLVFETLNEPCDPSDHSFNYYDDCEICKDNCKVLNELNQLIVDTIRDSGGNNAKRYIMVSTFAQKAVALNSFKLPKDKTSKDKFIVAIHNYPMGCVPREYDENGNIIDFGDIETIYSPGVKKSIENFFTLLDKNFFKKKIPVAITETGCPRQLNIIERINCMTDFVNEVNKKGRSCLISLHFNNTYDSTDNGFGYMNGETFEWYDNEYLDTILNLAARKEYKLSEEFIKNNELVYTPIVNQNILDKEISFDSWKFYDIENKVFYKRVPKKFKLEITYEVIPNSSETALSYCYYNPENNNKQTSLFTASTIKGGIYNSYPGGENIILDGSGKLTLNFNEKTSQLLEWYTTRLNCCGIILKSIKVIE